MKLNYLTWWLHTYVTQTLHSGHFVPYLACLVTLYRKKTKSQNVGSCFSFKGNAVPLAMWEKDVTNNVKITN